MGALRVVAGAQVEPLGDLWAAYSPLSNRTLLLNHEAAALVETLAENPCSLADAITDFGARTGAPAGEVAAWLRDAGAALMAAGLVINEPADAVADSAAVDG
jgi:hypothetical protein